MKVDFQQNLTQNYPFTNVTNAKNSFPFTLDYVFMGVNLSAQIGAEYWRTTVDEWLKKIIQYDKENCTFVKIRSFSERITLNSDNFKQMLME